MQSLENLLNKDNILYFNKINKDHKINKLLEKGLNKHLVTTKLETFPNHFWEAPKYNLHLSDLFKSLSVNQKEIILKELSQMNLSLSWYIERAAYNHGAKMVLLSPTQEEKMYYCQFSFEEAIHQREFENMMNFIPNERDHWHPMIDVLSKSIQKASRETGIFMVQVVLEGYGMYFYKSLMETCNHPELKKVYKRILIEEADHHGSGLVLSNLKDLKKESQDEIFEYTKLFLDAIQSSGQLIKSIRKVKSNITRKQEIDFLEQIKFKENLEKRVFILKNLLKRIDKWGLTKRLEQEDLFRVKEVK